MHHCFDGSYIVVAGADLISKSIFNGDSGQYFRRVSNPLQIFTAYYDIQLSRDHITE